MTRCQPAPREQYERGPCPTCGALTEDEAGDKCTPNFDETGEAWCQGEFDAEGFSVCVTAASVAAMDEWISKHADCFESFGHTPKDAGR